MDVSDQAAGTGDDDYLGTADVQRINEEFYAADPADYFRVRLMNLVVLGARPNDVVKLLEDGCEYMGVPIQVRDAEVDDVELRKFVTIESQLLLHQASEAVLRLYIAHAQRDDCPWLAMSRERNFARFKERIGQEVLQTSLAQLADTAAYIFLGGRDVLPAAPRPRAGALEQAKCSCLLVTVEKAVAYSNSVMPLDNATRVRRAPACDRSSTGVFGGHA